MVHDKAMRKPDVLRLRAEQRALADLQDQKIDVLADKVADLDRCFQIAENKRVALSKLYQSRRQEIRSEIEKIREDIQTIFHKKHARVREFGTEWMETLQDAIKEWIDTLEDRSVEMEERLWVVHGEISGFHQDLEVEKKERKEEIETAVSGLLTHLEKIRIDLDATRQERLIEEAKYQDKFAKHFQKLNAELALETEIREEQWKELVKDLKEAYKTMHEKEDVIEKDIAHFLEEQQINLDVEEGNRVICENEMAQRSIDFIASLRENIEEDVVNARKRDEIRKNFTKARLADGGLRINQQ